MKTSRLNEIKLIFFLAVAVITFISLLSFDPADITFLTTDPNPVKSNVVGFVGAYLAWGLLFLMGYGSYIIPFFIGLLGILSFLEKESRKFYLRIFGAFFSILGISSIFCLLGVQDFPHCFERGGIIGVVFSDFLLEYLGTAGTLIAIIVLFLLAFLITTDFLIFPVVGWIFGVFKAFAKKVEIFAFKLAEKRVVSRKANPQKTKFTETAKKRVFSLPARREVLKENSYKIEKTTEPKTQNLTPGTKHPTPNTQKEHIVYNASYVLPSLDLLKSPPPIAEREIKENLEVNSRVLEETLGDFGVEVKVVGVRKGPVVTRYELEPASGVRVHKITSLSDNIALAMKAVTIRIEAPIPGKNTIGVEVPNQKSALVYLEELLKSNEYKGFSSKLKLALGKDISGAPIITDLDDMPHLLIAGTTGSGKTVCVNSIITALLFNASPEELKFLMVDPKRVEMALFADLPHLLAPVVTDAKKASHALNWIVSEMERRLDLFTELGVRNIAGYREKEKSENLAILPYIVVIIDELHDLMLVAQQEVEEMITRIAQLSRAVGIHMIIATQRPSVDVITGVIKANLPARISFKVASKVDSRTVIDMNGAEKLLGRGDMLFIEPGNPKPVRLQGALVSDSEINKITEFIKSQRSPAFEEGIVKVEDKPKGARFRKDEIYEEAVRLVLQTKQASVSILQRRLGVGYTRAARLIDMMEDERIIGSYQGSKPREILIENIEEQ